MDLSIVVPVYNVENYLAECLDSILSQKGDCRIQAILVDDGSLDQSSEIAKAYASKYPSVFEYYRKANGGLSDARNYGVTYAKGEYLMFLDSDDCLTSDACETIWQSIQTQHVDLLFFDYLQFDENDEKYVTMYDGEAGLIDKKAYLLCQPTAWNKVIKTALYQAHHIQFPKGIWYEDRATTGSYVELVDAIYYLKQGLYRYRQRLNSIMNQSQYNPKMLDMIPAIQMMLKQIDGAVYHDELSYICISNLVYQSGERLLQYHKHMELEACVVLMNEQFPDWMENPYFRKRSRLYQASCKAIQKKHYRIAKLLFYLKNKMI